MKLRTTKSKALRRSKTQRPRLRTALLNPQKATKRFQYEVPESFTSKPAVAGGGFSYQQDFGGCTVSVAFYRGSAWIYILGCRRVIGSARLVWHKTGAKTIWETEIAAYKDENKRLPHCIESRWRQPARPWVAISLDSEFVKNDRHQADLATALFACISHGVLQYVFEHADSNGEIKLRQVGRNTELANPFRGFFPLNRPMGPGFPGKLDKTGRIMKVSKRDN